MLHHALDLHLANWPGVLLAGIPLVVNLGLLVYARNRLPADRLNALFQVYILCAMGWQAFDVMVRLSATAEAATLWRGMLRPGQMLMVPVSLHFAVLYSERERLAQSAWFLLPNYAYTLGFLGAFQSGLIQERLEYHEGWGWLADSSSMGPANAFFMAFGGILALLSALMLVTNVYRIRAETRKRAAAMVIAVGIGIPTLTGVICEALIPAMGFHQWPITSTAATGFSLCTVIGLSRYQLFQVSTPAAAKAVIETITDALVIANGEGVVLYANATAGDLFGLDRERIQTHRLATLLVGDTANFDLRWRSALDGHRSHAVEVRLKAIQGDLPFLLSLAPIPNAHLGEPGVVLVAHDVTQMKAFEEELIEARDTAELANHSKSLFLANMSHELRTPLNAIIGYAELMMEDEVEPEKAQDLGRIIRSGRYLLSLIGDVLDLAKVESGKLVAHPEVLDLTPLLQEVAATGEHLASGNRNAFSMLLPDSLPPVTADPMRTRQVLLNLLSNATKFTEDGFVTVSVRLEDERCLIDVSDTGIGMTPDQIGKLFQLFTQVHEVDRERFGGTGLGLALSRRLCRLMEGDIHVISEHGKGTTFTVDLPVAPVG